MTTDRIQFVLYNDAEGSTMPATTYLRRQQKGNADWAPYLGLVSLSIKAGGKEHWSKPASMGILANLVVQFETAAARLAEGKQALVRSGVNDSTDAPFLLFEPEEASVFVSIFSMPDMRMGARYPVTATGAPVEEIYQYVDAHKAELLAQPDPRWRPHFVRLEVPRQSLITSLTSEAKTGRKLYTQLGQEFRPEIYGD